VRIERLLEREGLRLRAIRLRALRDAPDAFGDTVEEETNSTEAHWSAQIQNMATFVAVVGQSDVGMVRCSRNASHPDIIWLLSMWVAGEARGQGVGEALINEVISLARAQGAARIILDVGDYNTPAIALYKYKGFERNGVVGYLPSPREHIREHQRELRLIAAPTPLVR
jgi:ribosomal protein S18 acetylase RimI-like enzyme